MALEEGGGVCPADQFHVADPGPAQHHHEHPYAVLPAVSADVRQTPPVHPDRGMYFILRLTQLIVRPDSR